MEVFWASRFHNSAAKTAHLNFNSENHLNLEGLQGDDYSRENHLNLEGLQGDDYSRAYFPCPFCYIEIELRILCNHLQEEHCFGLDNAVCPLCAANLGGNALGHFTVQHSQSVKRKRKSQKSGFWSNCPTTMGKDFREMNSFFGSSSFGARSNVPDPTPDPLLSPFLCNMSLPDPKVELEDKSSNTTTSFVLNEASHRPAILNDFSKQDYRERERRAAFAQELIISTIFEI